MNGWISLGGASSTSTGLIRLARKSSRDGIAGALVASLTEAADIRVLLWA
jgi:hypothetical protein